MEIVEVVWLDAGLESMQLDLDSAKQVKVMPRRNVGYCLKKDREQIILVFGEIEDNNRHCVAYDQTLVIPRSIVKQIRVLEPI